MSARAPSLRERQRSRTRTDLVNAALSVLARRGLEAATVTLITQAAGTSRATLYAHFPEGRSQLLLEAYEQLGHRVLEAARSHRAGAEDWAGRIRASLVAMLELASEPEIGLFYNVSGPQLVGRGARGIGSSTTRRTIADELELARSRGLLAEGVDPDAPAALLVGAIREAGIDAALEPSSAAWRLAAFDALLRGLSAR